MTYIAAQDSSDGLAKVIYQANDAKKPKHFMPWIGPQRTPGCPASGMPAQALAQLVTHIPNKGESA